MKLKVKKLVPHAKLPVKGNKYAAGLDLHSVETKVIPAGKQHAVRLGISVSFPEGYALLLWDRSGLASRERLHCLAGVIDCDYRGELSVVITNLGDKSYLVTQGDRVCQALLQRVEPVEVVEVDDLSKTKRGEKGFGSTGKSSVTDS